MDTGTVAKWISEIAKGDEVAIGELVECYYNDLVRLARRKLSGMPPQVADDEGAVLSALRRFFGAVQADRFPRLNDRHDLWKVLATLTVRKAIAQVRRHWKKSGEGGKVDRRSDLETFLDRGPGPDQVAMLVDLCQTRVDRLGDETLKKIAVLRLEGYETNEIAQQLDVSQRTIQRKLAMIYSAWCEATE